MTVKVLIDNKKQSIRISITGSFTFHSLHPFSSAYKNQPHKISQYIVDLSTLDYLDSAALGMLLQLKEYTNLDQSGLKIIAPPNAVYEILSIVRSDKLFTIQVTANELQAE